jgi:dephospho-CoA kinase
MKMGYKNFRIVGISGHIQSGKSTVAEFLSKEFGYKRIRFADAIKGMLKHIGLTQEQIEGTEKEVPLDLLCGKTPRFAMQMLGTEYGRNLLGKDVWARIWRNHVEQYLKQSNSNRVVVEDIRFENELEVVKKINGFIIRIERPGNEIKSKHESETALDGVKFETVIINDGTKENLFDVVRDLIGGSR